jgi:dTDP-4-amino-4,6-dideoxy-D-galactose acyltransferase
LLKFEKLNWDSEFFEISVAQIKINNQTPLTIIEGRKDLDLVYINSDSPIDIPNNISYQGTKVEFRKKLDQPIGDIDVNIQNIDILYFKKHRIELQNIAYTSGEHSRFYLDTHLDKSKFFQLYDKWLENAIYKLHDNVFLVHIDSNTNTPTGILTGRIDNVSHKSKIGLFAVKKEYQGLGIGKSMLLQFEKLAFDSNQIEITIPTQHENAGACQFYCKMNYLISKTEYIYHYWI